MRWYRRPGRSGLVRSSIRSHVEAHHQRLRTIEDVARECHVTPMYIARLLRRFARAGAYRFLLRLRMNRAAELLLDEGLMVKEVADRLGFPDAFTFCGRSSTSMGCRRRDWWRRGGWDDE
jgi:AraC-like DNA-binding protein